MPTCSTDNEAGEDQTNTYEDESHCAIHIQETVFITNCLQQIDNYNNSITRSELLL